MELGQIAELIMGVLVSREAKEDGIYTYSLFNIKNYKTEQEENEIIQTTRPLFDKLTRQDDIIFRLVCPNKMFYVSDKKFENKLISSHFCVIRANKEMIDPVFLKWYLEYGDGKNELKSNTTGSTVKKITMNDLRKITIPNINIETQRKLKDLILLWEREKKVLKEIVEKKDVLYNGIIEEIIDKENN